MYSDSFQSTLKYLKNIEANIHNVLVITGNFNIRDSYEILSVLIICLVAIFLLK